MKFEGTRGDDTFVGTNRDDVFRLEHGGVDSVMGLGGNDDVYVLQPLAPGDRFDGGDGEDFIVFGEMQKHFAFNGDNCGNFESIEFYSGTGQFTASVADACDPIGHTVSMLVISFDWRSVVDASAVTGNLRVRMTDHVHFTAGSGEDILDGGREVDAGAGNDTLGGLIYQSRNETMTGGAGVDLFTFYVTNMRTYAGKDTITDFDPSEEKISISSSLIDDYSQLKFVDDEDGGTIVVFDRRQSVDLQHVARDTLSESNFIFTAPSAQPLRNDMAVLQPENYRMSSHPFPGMIGAHVWHGDLHAMAHPSVV